MAIGGCSSARKAIERDAATVKREAQAVKDRTASTAQHADNIIGACAVPQPDCTLIIAEAKAIKSDQAFIAKRADAVAQAGQRIDDNADHVQDTEDWFGKMLRYAMYVAIFVGCILVWKILRDLGIAPVIKSILGWFPALIDWLKPDIAREADAAVKVLDDDDAMDAPQAVAARRGRDPLFDAAFERKKRLHEERKAARLLEQNREVVAP